MLRLLIAFVVIVVVTLAAVWVAEHPGELVLEWGGWQIETTIGVALLALLIFIAVAAVFYRVWLWLKRVPLMLGGARAERRRRQGYQALTRGMVAVAGGDEREAKRLARRAERLLDEPVLTMLLAAQVAQLAGDEAAVEEQYRTMAEREDTELLGLRGLLTRADRAGDREQALRLARRAAEIQPKAPWVLRALFELLAESGLWDEAARTLERAARRKAYDEETVGRHMAAIRLAQARDAERSGRARVASSHASAALKANPALVPAAALLGRLLAAEGKQNKAERVICDAWSVQPHPELAAAWLGIHPDDTPAERLLRLEALRARNEHHRETHILLADAAMAVGDWRGARQSLEAAGVNDERPDARVCRIMADYEQAFNGDPEASRRWLLQAAHAPSDVRWICRHCGRPGVDWQPLCATCGAFNSLAWETAPKDTAREAMPRLVDTGEPKLEAVAGPAAVAPAVEATADVAEEPPRRSSSVA